MACAAISHAEAERLGFFCRRAEAEVGKKIAVQWRILSSQKNVPVSLSCAGRAGSGGADER
jgi:hypothetical protein